MNIPISTVENMYPFERDLYIALWNDHKSKEKEKNKKNSYGVDALHDDQFTSFGE